MAPSGITIYLCEHLFFQIEPLVDADSQDQKEVHVLDLLGKGASFRPKPKKLQVPEDAASELCQATQL